MNFALKAAIRQSLPYKLLGNHVYRLRGKLFDWKYNIETASEEELRDLKIDSPNAGFGTKYAGTDPKFFRKFLNEWEIAFENFVFVDFGSGKGRAILMASEHPFKKIIGVEFSTELNQTAQANIRNYKNPAQKCRDVQSVCQDAATFPLPAEPTIFYIFNPFGEEVISKVLKNIEDSLKENPREVYIVYAYAAHNDLFQKSRMFKEIYSGTWHTIHQNVLSQP
jgi:hypothetical protein